MNTPIVPINVANTLLLLWAEPDSYGDKNIQLYPIRGTSCFRPRVEIPEFIAKRIKENASPDYPILIIRGNDLETLLDRISYCDKVQKVVPPKKTFGEYPRKETKPDEKLPKASKNSVEEFLEAVKNGETF